MDFMGKEVALIGLGVSNTALAQFLVNKGAIVTGCDKLDKDQLPSYARLKELGIRFQLGPDYLHNLQRFSVLFISPGVHKDLPEITAAKKSGVSVSSETQIFLENCKGKTIGVSGSSGKTTTTTLIGQMLKSAGFTVHVGGNIGNPLINDVDNIQEDDWVVLELSSFQLELNQLSPHISLITNITPNHLDYHHTMENYIEAKKGIYKYQTSLDWLVLNANSPLALEMSKEARGKVMFFGKGVEVARGTYIFEDDFVYTEQKEIIPVIERVCPVNTLRLLGDHNKENALAAIAVAKICLVNNQAIRSVLQEFTGVPHRLELVGEIGGVKYYNDSIATTPTRAVAAIRSFDQPIILIAGGYDKKIPFDEMAQAIGEKVRLVFLVGQTKELILESVKKVAPDVQVNLCEDFTEAVLNANRAAHPGEVVLLSPGCASYGMFQNFEERGQLFRTIVGDLVRSSIAVH